MSDERFFEKARRLDNAIAESTQAREEVIDSIADLLAETSLRSYFFDRLDDPQLLRPLKDRGYFATPPPPISDEEGRVRFPSWPESQYLARMAAYDPRTVLEIIHQIPHTENVRVHEDLADAADAMPAELAAKFVDEAKTWLESPYHLVLPSKLGSLLEHLAKGGQVEAALDLTRALLALRSGTRRVIEISETERHSLPPEPEAKFDVWDYRQILEENVPHLVTVAKEDALLLLCDILEDAAHISQDPSFHIQRPAIEEHSQNEPYGLVHFLISAVRNSAEQLANENRIMVRRLVQMLEQRELPIFDRLSLYLLWRFSNVAPDLVAERLTDYRRFDELGLRHEYALLARSCFATLDSVNKEKILSWIEEGPDVEIFRTRYEEREGNAPSEEEAKRYARLWRRDRLALFDCGLPEKWQRRYDQLVEEFGPAEHPSFVSYRTEMWVGPASPITAEDLHSMNVMEIVQYLASWEPSGDFMSPSPEGLGRELSEAVASDPERFAAASSYFRRLDPTYVRAYFNGLREVAKRDHLISWSPVIDLCQWVLQQPREIPEREAKYKELIEHHDLDPDWGWTRKAIAGLLSQGFEDSNAQIPFELRTAAWGALRPLTDDLDPTPEHEARYGGSNMDPATLSLNTTRSQAMHGIVRYALWVRRNLEETTTQDELTTQGFDSMLEVREVLDHRLDPSLEPSLAVRAVYGWWFPQLTWLDERWATQNVMRIFPSAVNLRNLHDAAWSTYLVFSQPNNRMLHILGEAYSRAVERLSSIPTESRLPADPDQRLAEHLATFYWWGVLELSVSGGLLPTFYNRAPDTLRAHALGFLGRNLHRISSAIPADTLERLQLLWESRLRAAQQHPNSHQEEVAEFGWWFASEKFDTFWAIAQLKEALKLTAEIKPYNSTLDRLAALTSERPLDTVECLQLIIKGAKEGWRIGAYREAKRNILRAALHSQDHEARQVAENLINRLGAQGYWDFRDLLQEVR